MKLNFPLKTHDLKRWQTAVESYTISQSKTGGWFPITRNAFFHGGTHLDGRHPVHAIADGEGIAYRISNAEIDRDKLLKYPVADRSLSIAKHPLSNNFVLTRHAFTPPDVDPITFYVLYMHLLPLDDVKQLKSKAVPIFLQSRFIVKKDLNGQKGLKIYNMFPFSVIGTIPPGAEIFFEHPERVAVNHRLKPPDPDEKFKSITHYKVNGKPVYQSGYVMAEEASMEVKQKIDYQLDQVVNVNIPIRGGDVIGFAGPDGVLKDETTVHMEVFIKDEKSYGSLKTYTQKQKTALKLNDDHLLNLQFYLDGNTIINSVTEGNTPQDKYCDIKMLLQAAYPLNGSTGISRIEDLILKANHCASTVDRLSRLVVKAKSEWQTESGEFDRLKTENGGIYPPEKFKALLELHQDKLDFWHQVTDVKDAKEVYFFHPIRFIGHLKRLNPEYHYNFSDYKVNRAYYTGERCPGGFFVLTLSFKGLLSYYQIGSEIDTLVYDKPDEKEDLHIKEFLRRFTVKWFSPVDIVIGHELADEHREWKIFPLEQDPLTRLSWYGSLSPTSEWEVKTDHGEYKVKVGFDVVIDWHDDQTIQGQPSKKNVDWYSFEPKIAEAKGIRKLIAPPDPTPLPEPDFKGSLLIRLAFQAINFNQFYKKIKQSVEKIPKHTFSQKHYFKEEGGTLVPCKVDSTGSLIPNVGFATEVDSLPFFIPTSVGTFAVELGLVIAPEIASGSNLGVETIKKDIKVVNKAGFVETQLKVTRKGIFELSEKIDLGFIYGSLGFETDPNDPIMPYKMAAEIKSKPIAVKDKIKGREFRFSTKIEISVGFVPKAPKPKITPLLDPIRGLKDSKHKVPISSFESISSWDKLKDGLEKGGEYATQIITVLLVIVMIVVIGFCVAPEALATLLAMVGLGTLFSPWWS